MKATKRQPPTATRTEGGMTCPKCGTPSGVLRTQGLGHEVRRRRECPGCGARFNTVEAALEQGMGARVRRMLRLLREQIDDIEALTRNLERYD